MKLKKLELHEIFKVKLNEQEMCELLGGNNDSEYYYPPQNDCECAKQDNLCLPLPIDPPAIPLQTTCG